ncbi:MAG TPA: gliding motility-associated C-terminal domain-containing protein, partial [Chryseolinea sp.]|nr:gliding motility-associated C-terminal domain-containing protein [Chryseolinea sp.]
YTLIVNSKPVVSQVSVSTNEDVPLALNAGNFAGGFSDADGNPLAEIQIIKLPVNGELLTATGTQIQVGEKFAEDVIQSLVYKPSENFHGIDSLGWNGADGLHQYAVKSTRMTITVNSVNDIPVIKVLEDESDTLFYEVGGELPVQLTKTFDGEDPDGDELTSAAIAFKSTDNSPYRPLNDVLSFNATAKIKGEFNSLSGVLSLTGKATATEYDSAIRSIQYSYVNALDLILDTRSVSITLSDGQLSVPRSRTITLIYTFKDLLIPSAFSPEGDNVNETWVIKSPNGNEKLYDEADVKVYDKRGQLLYQARGLDNPWDGVYNGSLLPPDTYFYTINLNYNRVQYKGMVTLLR